MSPLKWTDSALEDVGRLYDFLAEKNVGAAIRAVEAILQGVMLLQDHPAAGRPAQDRPPEYREWPVTFGSGGYVALYRFDGTNVMILAVKHGREVGY